MIESRIIFVKKLFGLKHFNTRTLNFKQILGKIFAVIPYLQSTFFFQFKVLRSRLTKLSAAR